MCKRLIALISAVVLCCSLFAVPAFAAEDEVYFDIDYGFLMSAHPDSCGVSFITIDNVLVEYETVAGEFGALEFGRIVGAGSTINVSNVTSYCFSFKGFLPDQEPSVINSLFGTVLQPSSNGTVSLSTNPGSYGASIECVVVRLIYRASDVAFCEYSIARKLRLPGIEKFDPSVIRQEGYDAGYQAGVGSTDAYQEGFTDGAASIDQESIRQEGYDDGYDVGFGDGVASIDQDAIRQEGYDDGYSSAMQLVGDLSGGMFQSMVLGMDVSVDVDGRTIVENFDNVPFDKTEGGVYFRSTLNFLLDTFGVGWEDRVTQVILRLQFAHGSISGQLPIDWSSSPILISGSALVDSAQLKSIDNVLYALTAQEGSYGSLRNFEFNVPSDVTYPVIFKEFSLKVGRPGDLLNEITLWSNSQFYGTGYAAGYADGLSSDSSSAYDTGYAEGYDIGFAGGKKEGLEISNTGDWKSLMLAVVEAPINTFQSLFNFEILGLDMRLAFGSILSVCVLLIIIKKVVL